MDDHFFELYFFLLSIMGICTFAFTLSITNEQVENKDSDGKIKFNKFQYLMISVFRNCLYIMLFVACFTIVKGALKWLSTILQ